MNKLWTQWTRRFTERLNRANSMKMKVKMQILLFLW